MYNGRKVISFCVTRLQDDFIKNIVEQLHRALKAQGHILLVYTTSSNLYWNSDSDKGESSIYDLVDMDITDLLIVFSEKIDTKYYAERLIERAQSDNVPVVVIGEPTKGCANVRFDYVKGFKNVCRHVINDHGIKDVHLMGGVKDNAFSQERVDAFAEVLKENGIPFDESMVSYGEFWSVPTEAACEELLKREKLPRALISCNDTMGITAINYFKRHGLRVPDDIIVTGFDGINDINFCEPRLTSCICSPEDLAASIKSLADMSFAGEDIAGTECLVTPKLLTSESCGCEYTGGVVITEFLNTMEDSFYRFQEEYRTLNEITTRILKVRTPEETYELIKNYHENIYDADIILNDDCFDDSTDPLHFFSEKPFSDKRMSLLATDFPDEHPHMFDGRKITAHLDKTLEGNMPLIFTPLHLLSRPLGYICFHFWNYDIANYIKIPQIKSCISNAMTSYIYIRYQDHINRRIEDLYKTDALTGLLNRTGFFREYTSIVAYGADEGITLAIADLDGLKGINDNYGHDEGDYAIHAVAQALRLSVPKGAVCARFGGDEIIAVFKGEVDNNEIEQHFMQVIENINSSAIKPYRLSASIGIYTDTSGTHSRFEDLLKGADRLMYEQKEQHHKQMQQ
ncbi:MAG: GGDEF domain-containing protein [Ruminococcus sp.]|nr:GGDEF domain-containing protein [Ruminococcus sp.]